MNMETKFLMDHWLNTDAEVAETVQKVFTSFQSKQSRINQQRAGITDLRFNDAGGNNITVTL